ncbi:MAG: ribosome-associated translation inhibitor RaiA [Patescibacteria group bacterium]|nr:ribosome-associated translation inhibitor RaiA [Patescibacteria group bacterium]
MLVINIRAVGMDLTPAIRSYVEEKINSLEKFMPNTLQVDVDIGKDTNHHNKGKVFTCVANMEVPGENLIRVEKTAESLYKSIDKVKDHLREILANKKNKIIEERRKPASESL